LEAYSWKIFETHTHTHNTGPSLILVKLRNHGPLPIDLQDIIAKYKYYFLSKESIFCGKRIFSIIVEATSFSWKYYGPFWRTNNFFEIYVPLHDFQNQGIVKKSAFQICMLTIYNLRYSHREKNYKLRPETVFNCYRMHMSLM